MFAPHWSAFLEGNYMDFGTNNNTVFGVGGCGVVAAWLGVASIPNSPRPPFWLA
jgi:hypothetical protein